MGILTDSSMCENTLKSIVMKNHTTTTKESTIAGGIFVNLQINDLLGSSDLITEEVN